MTWNFGLLDMQPLIENPLPRSLKNCKKCSCIIKGRTRFGSKKIFQHFNISTDQAFWKHSKSHCQIWKCEFRFRASQWHLCSHGIANLFKHLTIATQYAPIIDLLQENSNTFRPALPTVARVSFDHKTRWEDLLFNVVQSAMCYVLCIMCYVQCATCMPWEGYVSN